MQLQEHETIDCIRSTQSTEIYRGRRTSDGVDVIMKTPAAGQPVSNQIARYRNEYCILQHLDDSPYILPPLGLEYADGRPVLILRGGRGLPLSNWLDQQWPLPRLVRVAHDIALALASIHERRVIHKDIKPHNILLDPETDEIRIIDFGISVSFAEENIEAVPLSHLEGTFAYMSPEQTGRMNRNVDFRSDLYSLGVTLYQFATGVLPFTADTPLDWCYAHLARVPTPAALMRPALPAALASILDKLLAKAPEERYQTAIGLAHDLALCEQAISRGEIDFELPLGSVDFQTTIRVPHNRYGREVHISALTNEFRDTKTNNLPRIVTLAGRSGVGKSALAQFLRTTVIEDRGYFLAGKFQQDKEHVPYTGIAQAIGALLDELLSANEVIVAQLRRRVQDAVGNNGQVVLDILPELESLIGLQSPVPTVGPTESEARLVTVFGDLLVALLDRTPAVLFIDDMQWSDRASIKLINNLLGRRNLGPVLMVLAYREDELADSHPLLPVLAALKQKGIAHHKLVLEPLDLISVTQLVADTLDESHANSAELAALVYDKAGGNPLFIRKFLHRIHSDGALRCDPAHGWQWDLDDIRERAYTDNVAEYLVAELEHLPAETTDLLFLAACMGSRFSLADVHAVHDQTPQHLAALLRPAIDARLVLPLRSGYQLLEHSDAPTDKQLRETRFRFAHDRVQQAAYEARTDAERRATHLRVARAWRRWYLSEELEVHLFEVMHQLAFGMGDLDSDSERHEWAKLAARAGERAQASTAYDTAVTHLDRARSLLGDDPWTHHHQLTWTIHLALAECESARGAHDRAAPIYESLTRNATGDLDRVRVLISRMVMVQVAGDYPRAVELGLQGLALLGREPPTNENLQSATQELFGRVMATIGERKPTDLLEAPSCQDPSAEFIAELAVITISSAYVASPQHFPWLVLVGMDTLLAHGNPRSAGFIYCIFGSLQILFLGDVRAAYDYAEMSIELTERQAQRQFLGAQLLMHADMYNHWSRPFATGVPLLERSFATCREVGDLVRGGIAAAVVCWQCIERGDRLADVILYSQPYAMYAQQTNNKPISAVIRITQQFCACLAGQTRSMTDLSDDNQEQSELLQVLNDAQYGTGIGLYHALSQILHYLAGDYAASLDASRATEQVLGALLAQPMEGHYYWFRGLALCGHYQQVSADERVAYRTEIEQIIARYEKWAIDGAANFAHRHHLLQAEWARACGDERAALDNFERAITEAQAQGYLHWAGLAHERFGRYALMRNHLNTARAHIAVAARNYRRWGATGLEYRLREQFADALGAIAPVFDTSTSSHSTHTTVSTTLDDRILLEASRLISSSLELDELVARFIRIAKQSTGADQGCMVLLGSEGAPQVIDDGVPVPLADADNLARVAVEYTLNTSKPLLVGDAQADHVYRKDPHVAATGARSLLCVPIIRQGTLEGVLYLQNSSVSHAFTVERTEVLSLLAAQAAVSLRNAMLYEQLQESRASLEVQVAARTAELERAKRAADEARALAEAANEAKGNFLAQVSHEIRNPMNAIIGLSMLLLEPDLSPHVRDQAALIRRTTEGLLVMLNDLLDFSKIEAGKMTLEEQRYDIRACMGDVIELMSPLARKKNLQLNTQISDDLPECMLGDAGRVRQILSNLISNAIKFTEVGSVTLKAHPDATPEGEKVLCVSVRDTGIGIPEEVSTRLFSAYTQASAATARIHGGTGLGLAISKQLVELMGGQICVDSRPGHGSTFHFWLPLRAQPGAVPTSVQAPATSARPVDTSLTLLVVDDNPINRRVTSAMLQKLGYQTIHTAVDGLEAVEAASQRDYDLIFLDLQMPRLDGLGATRQIRQRAASDAQPRIIALTGSVARSQIDACFDAGMDDYLSKPVLLESLEAALERVTGSNGK